MKALVQQGDGKVGYVTDRPEPKTRPGYVKVQTKAVALNPTDWKHAFYPVPGMNNPDHLVGCDYSGVVTELGPNSDKQFKPGDKICGFTHGSNHQHKEDGSFAEVIVAKAGIQLHVPEGMSWEDAATLGVAIMTCGQGLYQEMGLKWPSDPADGKEWILIYGGSSAMGTMGVQLAKLSGYRVVATCSKRNFEMVKQMGAEEVFDYNDPAAVEDIKRVTGGGVKLVWDTISEEETAEFCGKVLMKGGRYGQILMSKVKDRDDLIQTASMGYTSVGEVVTKFGTTYDEERVTRDYEFMKKWMTGADKFLKEGKIRPHPTKVSKGLDAIEQGMLDMKDGKVSGQKLVYTVE